MKKLQVMICTFGPEGIERVANAHHPVMDDVEYIVGWQLPDGDCDIPESLKARHDFKIYKTDSKGLSKNRNFILSKATAPLLLVSDDDADYYENCLREVIHSFEKNPDLGLITFKYDSYPQQKNYPEKSFSLSNPPKGYYISSLDIAFRRELIQGRIFFNENFGVGATFISGEEEIFCHDCLKSGIKGAFVPVSICRHDASTTSSRHKNSPEFIRTKGAVISKLHPKSWPLKLITHLIRNQHTENSLSTVTYLKEWIKGVRLCRTLD